MPVQLKALQKERGLELVSLARLAIGNQRSARDMMKTLSGIEATLVQVRSKQRGRPATVSLAPDLTREQQSCVETFYLGRWMPGFHLVSKVGLKLTGGPLREKNTSVLRKSGTSYFPT